MRSPQESAASWDPPRQTARGPAFRRTLQSSAQSRDVLDGAVADRPREELGHAALAIRSADPASLPPGAPRAPASNNLRSRQTEGDVEVERSLDNRNERLCQPLTPALSPKRRGKCHERGAACGSRRSLALEVPKAKGPKQDDWWAPTEGGRERGATLRFSGSRWEDYRFWPRSLG